MSLCSVQIRCDQILYNNFNMQMSGTARGQEINNNQHEKSRIATSSDYAESGQVFNVELTVSQANAISKILPKSYSIHIDRTIKTKRVVKRKFTLESKNYKSTHQGSQEIEVNQMAEEQPYNSIQTMNYDEMIRKCQKMLNMLLKNKSSWPFKDPVDPIAMGIPHYRDIITNPMDLRTVGQNLLSHKYSTISQFYADIQLIISNSYTFNKSNQQFCTLTSQFQKYFQKIKTDPIVTTKVELPIIKKISTKTPSHQKKQSDNKSSSQLAQRKQIAMKLKYLPKQQLTQLIHRMNDYGEKNTELNLETLPMEKIRFLQEYIFKKENSVKTKQEARNAIQDQSPFQSDSDS